MKSISVILAGVLMAGSISSGALAASTSVNVSFEPSSGQITLAGNAEGITSIMVSKEDAASNGTLPAYFKQITVSGQYEHKLYLPENSNGGIYKISIADDIGTAETDFIFFDVNVAQQYIKMLNDAQDCAEFVGIAVENAMNLGVDVTDSEYSENVFELMYNVDKSYTDSDEFYTMYTFCKAICAMQNKSEDDVQKVLKKYESVLGISFSDDFENNKLLTTKAKSRLCKLLSTMDYSASLEDSVYLTSKVGFKAVYDAMCALSVAGTTTSVGMEKLYTEECAFLKQKVVNKNKYYADLSPVSVFVEMLDMKFEKTADLIDNFDLAVDYALSAKNNNSTSHGGGGGGGSFVTAPSVSSGVYEDMPSEKIDIGSSDDSENGTQQLVPPARLPSLSQGNATFYDVAETDWFFGAVSSLGANNIINGDANGAFRPNDSITRAEFAKLIVSAFSISGNTPASFKDVSSDAWYVDYVSKAASSGVVTGYDGFFNPDAHISRQDAAVMIYRVSSLLGKAYTGFEAPDDIDTASLYAYTAIGTLYRNGIIKGNGNGCFVPLSNITRAEAAQLLYNTIIDLERR